MPMTVADILSALTTNPAGRNTWKIPTAGTPGVPWLAPQGPQNMEAPYLYLAPPEPTSQVVTMPMPTPPVAAVAPPVAPTMPDTSGVSASVSGIPSVNIPDVAIPPAPVMPAGMTVEQAIAMGQALAPNVNLQPLTRQDILGTEDTSSLIGLLPQHVQQLMDTRTGLRASKAAEDAAAVALAKQTQGLDVAQDIAKDIPRQQQASALAQFGAKSTERLAAQKAKTDRDTEQSKLDAERIKLLYTANTKGATPDDELKQRIAAIKLRKSYGLDITQDMAEVAGLAPGIATATALEILIQDNANAAAFRDNPTLAKAYTLPPEMRLMLEQKIKSAQASTPTKDLPAMSNTGAPVKVRVPITKEK